MRKHLRKIIVLTALVLVTAMSVSAQSQRSGAINIPFNFMVGDKALSAGEYTVEPNRRDFDKVWLVQSRDGRASAVVMTMPMQATKTQEEAKLVFHKYGNTTG